MTLTEIVNLFIAKGHTLKEIRSNTAATFLVNDTVVSMVIGGSLCYRAEVWDMSGDIVPFNTISELAELIDSGTYHLDY